MDKTKTGFELPTLVSWLPVSQSSELLQKSLLTFAGVPATSPKLLIVDDEPLLVELLTDTMSNCGYEIRVAYDGVEAVAAAKDFRPDCVVIGIMMPNMDGFEAAKAILQFLPGCKFILMSGSADLREFQRANAALGFEERLLLEKPFTQTQIFDALKFAGFPCKQLNSEITYLSADGG